MERKAYMKDVYSQYWLTARETIYGFSDYDRNLCDYIRGNTPEGAALLDVAVGTGYPFADHFQQLGYSVHGVDISPDLVEECRSLNPEIEAKVGDAESLDYPDDSFDCAYCFHSTWYFPDLPKAIGEMLSVTRPGGLVMFDIQNRNNKANDASYRSSLFRATAVGRAIRRTRQVAKRVLRRGTPTPPHVVYEVPTAPGDVYRLLHRDGVSSFQVMVRNRDDSIEPRDEEGAFEEYARLVFAARKAGGEGQP